MTSITKFQFDTVFDVDETVRVRKVEEHPPQFTDEDLAAARAEGWQQGFEAGRQQAHNELQAAAAAALQTIGAALQQLDISHRQEILRIEAEAAELALLIASKLAPELISREPLAEINALITRCVAEMPNEPRLVIRLADALVDAVSDGIDDIVARSGFTGKVALIGEPGLSQADCRIEWADGGVERDIQSLQGSIVEAVARYRAAAEDDIVRLDELAEPATPAEPAAAPLEPAPPPEMTMPNVADPTALPEPMEAELPPLARGPTRHHTDADAEPDALDPGTDA